MIQEYLFIGEEIITDENELCLYGVDPEIENIKNSDCRIVRYISDGDNEESAKLLSNINETVIEKFNPTVLTNESSAYFNKRLYPLFNEFERKLRKLVYLKCALYNNKDETKALDNLERMDFGQIFDTLFTDEKFMQGLREQVKKNRFSSTSIIKFIKGMPENTLWSKLVHDGAIRDLEENFDLVRNHRNDIMHAHNISYKNYKEALKLIQKINEELDEEIGDTIGVIESKQPAAEVVDYNKIINETIASNQQYENLRKIQETIQGYTTQFGSFVSPNMPESLKHLNELLEAYNKPEISALQKLANSPAMLELLEYQRKLQEMVKPADYIATQQLENSPAMAELRELNNRFQENLEPSLSELRSAMSIIKPTLERDVATLNTTQDISKRLKTDTQLGDRSNKDSDDKSKN